MPSPEAFHELAAVVWLGILLAVAIGYLVLQVRRSPYTLWEDVLYVPTYFYGRVVWRVQFTNAAPSEMQGGAVLVANHRSSVDPFFVQLAAGRRVHWMVAREYCENVVLGPLLRALQVIPTNRSGMDTFATKLAIRLAREGRLVGMFPEGRLNHTRGPLVSIRPGAALVAVRAGVPLIPLFIKGSPYRREVWSPIFMPARVQITFGRPVDPRLFAEQNAAAIAAKAKVAAASEPPLEAINSEATTLDAFEADAALTSVPSGHSDSAGVVASAAAPGGRNGDRDRQAELAMAEEMIVHWGRQIVAMAGYPDWPIEVSGRSRLTRTRKEKL